MDNTNDFLEYLFQSLSYFSEYTAYIFIFLLLTFGFITYYLSIKVSQPAFEDQKNIKKRNKKEKILKNKSVVKDSSAKTQIVSKCDIQKSKIENKIAEIEPTENNDNETWIPVLKNPKKIFKQKLKKGSRNVSKVISELEVPMKSTTDDSKSQSIVIPSVCDNVVANEEITLPIITHDDKQDGSLKVETIPEQESEHEDITVPDVEDEEVENSIQRLSESPTNSSSDDFVLVDSCRMSSDETVTVEMREEVVDPIDSCGTSGASRKKTKKFQKIISKQLIEAAIIEGDERQPPVIEEYVPQLVVPSSKNMSSVVKKRRPRKDN